MVNDSWGIELVLRALAGSRVPVLPTTAGWQTDHEQYLAYWHGLHYLLVARLGWSDPGKGLRAWADGGRDSEDETLTFIEAVWGHDGHLDKYIAWATRSLQHSLADVDRQTAEPTAEWMRWAQLQQDDSPMRIEDTNGPHFGPIDAETEAIRDGRKGSILVVVDRKARRALYVTGGAGFYEDLRRRWDELPNVTPDTWRVEAFNRRLGYLGDYRRSRETGLLYVGKHSVHLLGN